MRAAIAGPTLWLFAAFVASGAAGAAGECAGGGVERARRARPLRPGGSHQGRAAMKRARRNGE